MLTLTLFTLFTRRHAHTHFVDVVYSTRCLHSLCSRYLQRIGPKGTPVDSTWLYECDEYIRLLDGHEVCVDKGVSTSGKLFGTLKLQADGSMAVVTGQGLMDIKTFCEWFFCVLRLCCMCVCFFMCKLCLGLSFFMCFVIVFCSVTREECDGKAKVGRATEFFSRTVTFQREKRDFSST